MLLIFVFFVTFLLLVVVMFRRQAAKDRAYFEKQGLMYLGNRSHSLLLDTILGTTIEGTQLNWYKKMVEKGQKVGGSMEFGCNVLKINDPEIVKHITIKDFDCFEDRRHFEMPKEEILFGKMLFAMKGKTWKHFRSTVSPAFTSGKIKRLYSCFENSGNCTVKYLQQQIDDSGHPTMEVDFMEVIAKFTIEIISTAVCGIENRTFEGKEPSLMERMSQRMQLNFGGLQVLKLILVMTFPWIANFFKMSFFDKQAEHYYMWAIKQTIKMREENPTGKNPDDFIQLMIEAKKGILTKNDDKSSEDKTDDKSLDLIDDNFIVANCVLFILAGYDTTQSATIFALYALATHPEIQERLREEVEKTVEAEKKDGNSKEDTFISYDRLQQMPYLDMFLSESLRLYSPTIEIDRGCGNDYKIPGTEFTLKKGQGVLIPIFSLHRDERFFPNPMKFDPERFSEENKSKIVSGSYIPFGSGQRSCIGMRFALTEAKLVLAILVYNYKIEPSANTLIPMVYRNGNVLKPKNGMKLNVTRIPRS